MSFTLIRTSSFSAGAMWSRTSSARYCVISADAERLRSAVISNAVIAATMRRSLTTHAATGTVPSVSPRHAIAGSRSRPPACCRCPTSTWSSPYPSNWRRSHSATSVCFTTCCSGPLPRRCWRSRLILAILALASVCSPCCTPGRRTWDIIRMFRGKLLSFFKQSYRRNVLSFSGTLAPLSQPRAFYSLLSAVRRKEWVVYSKPPFGGPEHVLKYLARYTHRVAISNGRLLSLENDQVSFRWRDSRHNNRSGVMTLDATEFIRRFLLHVLPAGFVKIRHFGLLANRNRRQALALCRIHLHATLPDNNTLLSEPQKSALNRSCPQCKCGTLHVVPQHFSGGPDRSNSLPARTHFDSS